MIGMNKLDKNIKGFTLIELLIAVAIIGVLAVGLLAIINPAEQLARGRDGGRKSAIAQLGRAVLSYYTTQGSVYPPPGEMWMDSLQTASEIKTPPTNPSSAGYTIGCNTASAAHNGYCYLTNSTDSVVFARAESNAEITKANCGTGTAWIIWSSQLGKTGLTCTSAATTDPAITGLTIN